MAQDVTPAGSFFPVSVAQPGNRPGWQGGERPAWQAAQQLFFVIFKWKWLILSFFVIFTTASAIAMYLKPPVRSASAEILIKVDRTPLQISGINMGSKSRISEIMNSEVALLKSREVLRPVALELLYDPYEDVNDVSEDRLDAKMNSLAGNTIATVLPDTTVLQVTYFAQTREEATSVLRLIVDSYIEIQAAIQSGSTKLLTFYEQEKQRVETELREAEDRLNEWQGKNETISINQQITNQLQTLEDRERKMQQIESELRATEAKMAVLADQLRSQPDRLLMAQDQVRNPLAMKLQQELVSAEGELKELLQRFTEKHRNVVEKREQIEFLKSQLAAEEANIVGRETTGLNPLRENLKRELSEAQTMVSYLRSQNGVVGRQMRAASEKLAELREKKVKIDELTRLVDLRRDVYMLYGKKLEESRIATGLGKEQLANVALIGAPYAVAGTDMNQRIKMIALAAIVGLALGLAIAFGFEMFNNALRTQQDVEYQLGLPVLAVIPQLERRPA